MEGRHIPSRPSTPLRPSSRGSARSTASSAFKASGYHQQQNSAGGGTYSFPSSSPFSENPLAALEPAFAELADGFADLEANMMHVALLHESVSRFSESFAAFLYGLNVNAFCVDFPEAPVPDSFRRMQAQQGSGDNNDGIHGEGQTGGVDPDATFISTGTSFIDHPSSIGNANTVAAAGRGARSTTTPRGNRTTTMTSRGRGRAIGTKGAANTSVGAAASRVAGSSVTGRGGRSGGSGIARGGTATGRSRATAS